MTWLFGKLRTVYRRTVPEEQRQSFRRLRWALTRRLSFRQPFWKDGQDGIEQSTPISKGVRPGKNDLSDQDVEARQIGAAVANLISHEMHHTYFDLWQKQGFHITPNHFYELIPDTSILSDTVWQKSSPMYGINMNREKQLKLLREDFPQFAEEYNRFPREKQSSPHKFYFDNGFFGGTDALVLYCMVRHFRPNLVLEVGSGYSTLLFAEAAKHNGNTRLICIEPYPADFLGTKAFGIEQIIPMKVQDVNPDTFSALSEGDILFIDTSHTVKIGGDVNHLFFNVLPLLKPGVIIHLHDIFLPEDYPKSWVVDRHIFWNEQYLLQAFLMYNPVFDVLFSNNFMGRHYAEEMKRIFPYSPWWGGGSFWMQKNLFGEVFPP